MAALRTDLDSVSWPSDSEMTVLRCKQRLPGRLGDGEHQSSPSLVNLAAAEEAGGGLAPLTSWVGKTHRGTWQCCCCLEDHFYMRLKC